MTLPIVKVDALNDVPVDTPFLLFRNQTVQQEALKLIFDQKGMEGINEAITEMDKPQSNRLGELINKKTGTRFVKSGLLVTFCKIVVGKKTGTRHVKEYGARIVKE